MFPSLEPGERVRADLTSPASVMTFPLVETIAWTGLIWIAIGLIDGPASYGFAPDVLALVRGALVVLWIVLVILRFLTPLVKNRRRRFVVTNRRIIARKAGLAGGVDAIPFQQIHSVRRRRKGLAIAVYGYERPLFYEAVPKARRVEDMINDTLSAIPGPYSGRS